MGAHCEVITNAVLETDKRSVKLNNGFVLPFFSVVPPCTLPPVWKLKGFPPILQSPCSRSIRECLGRTSYQIHRSMPIEASLHVNMSAECPSNPSWNHRGSWYHT